MATSLRTTIALKLLERLDLVTSLKVKTFDRPKLMIQDFAEWELPGVQLIDGAETSVPEHLRAKKTWNIFIEVVIGPTDQYSPKQSDLWDLMQEIEQRVFEAPKLNLGPVIALRLLGSSTDLALLAPLYSGRIEIAVDYYQPLVGNC